MKKAFGVTTAPGLVHQDRVQADPRTFTDRHGLKYLLADLVGVDVSKQQQTSDWGAETLTEAQKDYAASDVLLSAPAQGRTGSARLIREDRLDTAQRLFAFLPTRAELDLLGWEDANDIFLH